MFAIATSEDLLAMTVLKIVLKERISIVISMSKIIFESDRYFQLHDYINSHGQLLLRSSKNNVFKTNIDIIFLSTNFVQIASNLTGISISNIDEKKDIIHYKSIQKHLSYDYNHLFEIQSNGEKFYIQASFFHVYENDLEFNETSLNYDEIGQAKRIASSLNRSF